MQLFKVLTLFYLVGMNLAMSSVLEKPKIVFESHNNISKTLVDLDQSGSYTCMTSNSLGTSSYNFTIYIEAKGTSIGSWIGFIIMGSLLVLVMLFPFTALVVRHFLQKSGNQTQQNFKLSELERFIVGKKELVEKSLTPENGDLLPYDSDVKLDDIAFDRTYVVSKGVYAVVKEGFIRPTKNQKVAIKMYELEEFKSISLSEIIIHMDIGKHDDVIGFIGACTKLILERKVFAVNGSLQTFLRNNEPEMTPQNLTEDTKALPIYENAPIEKPNITEQMLVRWAYEIAVGMEYLASKSIVHQELMANNVLLGANLTAKLSEFGQSRQLYGKTNYKVDKFVLAPWRWMALESLSLTDTEFSFQSDVWSYGVTVWEIFSFGDTPFSDLSWTFDFADMLKSGMRFGIMSTTWDEDKSNRPTFTAIREQFLELLGTYSESKFDCDAVMKVKAKEAASHPTSSAVKNSPKGAINVLK